MYHIHKISLTIHQNVSFFGRIITTELLDTSDSRCTGLQHIAKLRTIRLTSVTKLHKTTNAINTYERTETLQKESNVNQKLTTETAQLDQREHVFLQQADTPT